MDGFEVVTTRRCSTCNVNYPTDFNLFRLCRACGDKTDHITEEEPHDNWQERVDAINGVYSWPELPTLPVDSVREHGGQHWIADESLDIVGYEERYVGEIIRVEGKSGIDIFFELDSLVVASKGTSDEMTGWWVHRIVPEDEWGLGEDVPGGTGPMMITFPEDDR